MLPENHRQSSDPEFFSIRTRVRKGSQTVSDIHKLNRTSTSSDTVVPPASHTRLVLTNEEAAKINRNMLSMLGSKAKELNACDVILTTDAVLERQARSRLVHVAPKQILSKIGARVLLTSKHGSFYPGTEFTVTGIHSYDQADRPHEIYSLCCIISNGGIPDENSPPVHIALFRTPIHDTKGS